MTFYARPSEWHTGRGSMLHLLKSSRLGSTA